MAVSVLLVDDNRYDRELARWMLRQLDEPYGPIAVTEVGSWDAARPLVVAGGFDLLLLDFNLPGPSGLDILNELRSRNVRVPVIMLTGHDDVGTATATLRAGAQDYVSKGVDWGPMLCRAVERALERARLRPPGST